MLALHDKFCESWRHYKTNKLDNIWVLTQYKLRQKLLVIQNKILSEDTKCEFESLTEVLNK